CVEALLAVSERPSLSGVRDNRSRLAVGCRRRDIRLRAPTVVYAAALASFAGLVNLIPVRPYDPVPGSSGDHQTGPGSFCRATTRSPPPRGEAGPACAVDHL